MTICQKGKKNVSVSTGIVSSPFNTAKFLSEKTTGIATVYSPDYFNFQLNPKDCKFESHFRQYPKHWNQWRDQQHHKNIKQQKVITVHAKSLTHALSF